MSYAELLRMLKTERKRVDRRITEELKVLLLRSDSRKKLEVVLRSLAS